MYVLPSPNWIQCEKFLRSMPASLRPQPFQVVETEALPFDLMHCLIRQYSASPDATDVFLSGTRATQFWTKSLISSSNVDLLYMIGSTQRGFEKTSRHRLKDAHKLWYYHRQDRGLFKHQCSVHYQSKRLCRFCKTLTKHLGSLQFDYTLCCLLRSSRWAEAILVKARSVAFIGSS